MTVLLSTTEVSFLGSLVRDPLRWGVSISAGGRDAARVRGSLRRKGLVRVSRTPLQDAAGCSVPGFAQTAEVTELGRRVARQFGVGGEA